METKPLITLLWGTGGDFSKYINLVQALEFRDEITVVGVTAAQMPYRRIYNYQAIPKDEVSRIEIDLIIVMTDALYFEVKRDIEGMGICAEIIPCGALSIPEFRVKEYLGIKNNIPTYFSSNCWAGLLYNRLRLRPRSPIINMFVGERDYIKFLKDPHMYLDTEPEFSRMWYDEYLRKEYPVALCKDIELHFNHYDNFTIARNLWNERAARVNWKRVIAMMYTEESEIAEEFLMLPYQKKMCFVPFDMDLDGVFRIEIPGQNAQFFELVNGIVSGRYQYYDILSLAKGEVKKVVE